MLYWTGMSVLCVCVRARARPHGGGWITHTHTLYAAIWCSVFYYQVVNRIVCVCIGLFMCSTYLLVYMKIFNVFVWRPFFAMLHVSMVASVMYAWPVCRICWAYFEFCLLILSAWMCSLDRVWRFLPFDHGFLAAVCRFQLVDSTFVNYILLLFF
jgi:hypothetical protein